MPSLEQSIHLKPYTFQSLLLRIWCDDAGRFEQVTVTNVASGDERQFNSMAAAVQFVLHSNDLAHTS